MHGLTILLAIKLLTLDGAYEEARKTDKPVIVYVHRKDWQGEEKIAKAFEGALGKDAERFVFAQIDATDNADAPKAIGVTVLDGGFAVVDPLLDPPMSLSTYNAADATPAGLKKAAEDGLVAFDRNAAIRKVILAMFDAFKKKDATALKVVTWPAQVKEFGECGLKSFVEEGGQAVEKWESVHFKIISAEEANDRMKVADPELQELWKVKFNFVAKDGKKDGTSFEVVKSGDKYCVVLEK